MALLGNRYTRLGWLVDRLIRTSLVPPGSGLAPKSGEPESTTHSSPGPPMRMALTLTNECAGSTPGCHEFQAASGYGLGCSLESSSASAGPFEPVHLGPDTNVRSPSTATAFQIMPLLSATTCNMGESTRGAVGAGPEPQAPRKRIATTAQNDIVTRTMIVRLFRYG